MAKIISGGGITGNKVKSVGVRAGGPSTNKISPRGVSQYGYATGSRPNKSGGYSTENTALPVNVGTMSQVPMGNAIATNVGKGGPGTARTVMRSGSQMMHGAPAPGNAPPSRGDILSQYGRETSSGSTVRRRS
jgi:hypothetical protein